MIASRIAKALIRRLPFARSRQLKFKDASPAAIREQAAVAGTSVLVLGVYLTDRDNCIGHLARRLGESAGLKVQQRWAALGVGPPSDDPLVACVTRVTESRPTSKYRLFNQLLAMEDWRAYDYVVLFDDDIVVQRGFLPALLAHQERYGFALAQPARTWFSHTQFLFVLRRPWLRARRTQFVESGPVVSFRRDAASLLMPFDCDMPLWGGDLVWSAVLRKHGLRLGIVDAVAVDHSLRPQSSTYDAHQQSSLMHEWLDSRPHLRLKDLNVVLSRHWR